MSDCSDAVGAGGVGENTVVLRVLPERGQGLRAYVPVRDAEDKEPIDDASAEAWENPLPRTADR